MSSYENVEVELEENGYESACDLGARTYRKLEARAGRIAQQIYDLQMYQLELNEESESVYAMLAKEALTEPESAKPTVCAGQLGSKAECFDYYFGEEPHSSNSRPNIARAWGILFSTLFAAKTKQKQGTSY